MKTKYKYVHFEQENGFAGWDCIDNKSKEHFGFICRNGRWWYFSSSSPHNDFRVPHLTDIIDFMKQLEKVNGEKTIDL